MVNLIQHRKGPHTATRTLLSTSLSRSKLGSPCKIVRCTQTAEVGEQDLEHIEQTFKVTGLIMLHGDRPLFPYKTD